MCLRKRPRNLFTSADYGKYEYELESGLGDFSVTFCFLLFILFFVLSICTIASWIFTHEVTVTAVKMDRINSRITEHTLIKESLTVQIQFKTSGRICEEKIYGNPHITEDVLKHYKPKSSILVETSSRDCFKVPYERTYEDCIWIWKFLLFNPICICILYITPLLYAFLIKREIQYVKKQIIILQKLHETSNQITG